MRLSDNLEKNSYKHKLNRSANMYETSALQFFKTTKSELDAIQESISITILTILGITGIWSSFRLVLDEEAGKEIHESSILDFSDMISANNFALLDAEDNSGPLNLEEE